MNQRGLRKTRTARITLGPGELAKLKAAEKRPAGGMVDAVPPSREAIQAAIREGKCPFCGLGPFKMLPVHTNKTHGIDKWALRDLAGLATTDPLCSDEVRTKMSEAAKRNGTHVLASAALKANGKRPQRWTAAGQSRVGHNLERWSEANPAAAAYQRQRATVLAHSPEAHAKRAQTIRKRLDADPEARAAVRTAVVARLQTPEVRSKRSAAIAASWAARLKPCGTVAAYKRGCRCEPCREAKRRSR